MKKKLLISLAIIIAIISLSIVAYAESYSEGFFEDSGQYRGFSEILGTSEYYYWCYVELYGDGALRAVDSGEGYGVAFSQTSKVYINNVNSIYTDGGWMRY